MGQWLEFVALRIESMMQMTRKRVQTTALGGPFLSFACRVLGCCDRLMGLQGLTHEDCRNVEKRLEEAGSLCGCRC